MRSFLLTQRCATVPRSFLSQSRPNLHFSQSLIRSSALSHQYKTSTIANRYVQPSRQGKFRRAIWLAALSVIFTTAGFTIAIAYVIPAIINPPTDAETLGLLNMADGESQEIDNYINSHPLANLLRSDPNMTESRPHLKIPDVYRDQSLTAGALAGPRKIVVPPLTWSEKTGKSLVAITYLGDDICGFPGIVHGGLLATLLDEGMARCCFPALPDKVGFTANLNINFRKPLRAGSFIVIKATTIKVDGRKALVEARIESLPKGDAEPVVFAEASGLFIQPKNGYQDMAKMLLAK